MISIKPKRPPRELVDITPLIDVVFMLLIFFMLAGAVNRPEAFDVAPPVSEARVRGDVQDVVLLIDAAGRIAIDDQPLTRAELYDVVRGMMAVDPGILIQIKADADVDAVVVIEIMELMREAGAQYLVLLTVGRRTLAEDAP